MTITNRTFAAGDIVWVPFPFVEAPRIRYRPALVVSYGALGGNAELLWVLMITSAANKGWLGDISIEHCYAECGLNVPCVIRTAKISTVEAQSAKWLGHVPNTIMALVRAQLAKALAL